ncbi:27234_t:CDS:2, partial [Dentiscutata erythropus]
PLQLKLLKNTILALIWARRRLQDGFKFSNEQIGVLIPNQRSGKNKTINIVEGNCRIVLASPPKNLEEEIIREKAKQILQNRYGFSEDQEETIREMARWLLQDKLSIRDVRAEAYALALSAKNANAGSSCLTCLRRELKNLGTPFQIIEATKFPDITKDANEI